MRPRQQRQRFRLATIATRSSHLLHCAKSTCPSAKRHRWMFFSFLTFSCVFKALLMSYAFVTQFFLAGGELHNLCRGLQLSIRVFQPIKRQTPQCKLVRCNGDLLLGSDLICLRPLQEGFCKCKEPCQTHREVPQGVSFFCKQN